LEHPWPLVDNRNELDPRILEMDLEAKAVWIKFHDHIEKQNGAGGALGCIQDFASKTAEHAARIAGVLTIYENIDARVINVEAMVNGIALAEWYLTEAARLQAAARTDPRLLTADRLLHWMKSRGGNVEFRDILRHGPTETRHKKEADDAVSILLNHYHILETRRRPRAFQVIEGDAK
jgi:hypothetical protein